MMSSAPLHLFFGLLFLLHSLFAVCAVLGGALLFAWAVKHLTGAKLKKVGVWLLGIGIVGCIAVVVISYGMMEIGERHGMRVGEKWMQRADDDMMQMWDEHDNYDDADYGQEEAAPPAAASTSSAKK